MKALLPLVLFSVSVASQAEQPMVLPEPATRQIDFVADIQPIFESKCIKCHGPEKQKGGYRLDEKEIALTGGDNHAPNIHLGKSAESPLIHFIAGLDPDSKMPPKGEPLSGEQIGLLRAWIDQGAKWPEVAGKKKKDPLDWWSLKPLTRPDLPPGDPAVNPIDRFVVAKLAEKGLKPSAEADLRTLVRRITFDLTGLPPSIEETDGFLHDAASDKEGAIERLTDRLLASERYGERWARHWLDVVHYGDTHGYDKDKPRLNAWPYRDYVIRAFNTDKAYGRFIQEQIAGDALFPGTQDGWAAPGFIAAGPWDLVGHAEVSESKLDGKIARLLDRDDMVANTMNTFCATTVQCARCHNHKFDPIKQEDYYRLQAVFAALDRTDVAFDQDPEVARRRKDLELKRSSLQREQDELLAKRSLQDEQRIVLLEKLIEEAKQGTEVVERREFGYHSAIEKTQDVSKWVQVDLGISRTLKQVTYVACHDTFNGIGAGFGFPVRYRLEISDDPDFILGVKVLEDNTKVDKTNPGVVPQTIDAKAAKGRYIRFTATKLAPRKGDFIFALAELQATDAASGENVALGAKVSALDSIEVSPRWGKSNLVDGYYYALRKAPEPDRIAALERERDRLRAKKMADPTGVARQLDATANTLVDVAAKIGKLPAPMKAYVGAIHHGTGAFRGTGPDGGKARPIFVLKRGDVRQPLEEVGPGTVPFFQELPSQFPIEAEQSESARRIALANWISSRANPLTWRVIVNRVWQYHFGRALCDSPNDFGRMGQQPTHPELLDWLAAEFRDGKQSFKELHRLIVTSATYRQSSVGNPETEKVDANNALLWRMNRRKLEAEAVHDGILWVAGKLDFKMGGPGYQDFVIDKPAHSPHYEYGWSDVEDASTHRRSIYRFIVRSQPQPFLTVLDCADPSTQVDKRNETVNALQALSMHNNRFVIAMARHMAERVEKEAQSMEEQLNLAYQLALNRKPTRLELEELQPFAKTHGLSNVCRLILNLNEFAFVD